MSEFTSPPGTLPEFAKTTGVIDPTSGEQNVVEPVNDAKLYGWIPFRKRPERNVFNWLHHWTWKQLDWLKNSLFSEIDTKFEKGEDVSASLTSGANFTAIGIGSAGSLVGGSIDFTYDWYRVGEIVTISLPPVFGTLDASNSLTIVGAPPYAIKHNVSMRQTCVMWNGGYKVPGYVFKQSGVGQFTLATLEDPTVSNTNDYKIPFNNAGDVGFDGLNFSYIAKLI